MVFLGRRHRTGELIRQVHAFLGTARSIHRIGFTGNRWRIADGHHPEAPKAADRTPLRDLVLDLNETVVESRRLHGA